VGATEVPSILSRQQLLRLRKSVTSANMQGYAVTVCGERLMLMGQEIVDECGYSAAKIEVESIDKAIYEEVGVLIGTGHRIGVDIHWLCLVEFKGKSMSLDRQTIYRRLEVAYL
jgi:hypothetical protein